MPWDQERHLASFPKAPTLAYHPSQPHSRDLVPQGRVLSILRQPHFMRSLMEFCARLCFGTSAPFDTTAAILFHARGPALGDFLTADPAMFTKQLAFSGLDQGSIDVTAVPGYNRRRVYYGGGSGEPGLSYSTLLGLHIGGPARRVLCPSPLCALLSDLLHFFFILFLDESRCSLCSSRGPSLPIVLEEQLLTLRVTY